MDSGQGELGPGAAERSYSFGYLVRRLRKARDLTQAGLARRAGCTASTIHKIECDTRRPSRALAERLAAIFALPDDERAAFIRSARANLAPDQLSLPRWPEPAAPAPAEPLGRGLPVAATPLVGRAAERARLGELLASPATRLVTVVGLGGVGKSRLALALAEHERERALDGGRFAHGVAFVPLAGLESAGQLEAHVAAALDLHLDPGPRPRRRQIVDYLRRKELLLVLDDYDRLLPEVELVAALSEAAPGVGLLITAREPLKLRHEHVLLLEGLAVGPDGDGSAASEAATLFLQAARRAQPAYAPGAEELAAIGALCRLVDGLPLAIELAAAWVALIPATAILAELRGGLDVLSTELRDTPPRHRSVRAVFDATWRRLGPPERRLFARLSCFRGGFTREAARAVAGAELTQLAHLAERALLRHGRERDRYMLHALLGQYGAARLAEDPRDEAATLAAHAGYYLGLLAERAAQLRGRVQREALAQLRHEDANLHAAWAWAAAGRRADLIGPAAASLGRYYERRGRAHEGEGAFRAGLAAVEGAGPQRDGLRATLLAWHGAFCAQLGRPQAAEAALRASLALLDGEGATGADLRGERAFALWRLGQVRAAEGAAEAAALYGQSLALYRALGRDWEVSAVLADLGDLLNAQGRYAEAKRALRESQALCERGGDSHGLAQALQLLSRAYVESGQPAAAEGLARRSVAVAQALGSRSSEAAALGRLGMILLHSSRYGASSEALRQSLALYEDLGDEAMSALAHGRLALALLHLGAFAEGGRHAQLSVALARPVDGWILAQGLQALAFAEEATGDLEAADAALEEALGLSRAHGLVAMTGTILADQCAVAWELGARARGRARALEALRLAVEQHNPIVLGLLLLGLVVPLVSEGLAERAAELYALDERATLWDDSRLAARDRARALGVLEAALGPEGLAAALARGRRLQLWDAARDLLAELEAAGWGAPEGGGPAAHVPP